MHAMVYAVFMEPTCRKRICTYFLPILKLPRHDLRVPVGSVPRFKFSLPQCNVLV